MKVTERDFDTVFKNGILQLPFPAYSASLCVRCLQPFIACFGFYWSSCWICDQLAQIGIEQEIQDSGLNFILP
jgi:hypothetical protein